MASRRAICCWLEVKRCLPAAYACGRHLHLCPRVFVCFPQAGAPAAAASRATMDRHVSALNKRATRRNARSPAWQAGAEDPNMACTLDETCSLHHASCCAVSSLRRCTLRNAPCRRRSVEALRPSRCGTALWRKQAPSFPKRFGRDASAVTRCPRGCTSRSWRLPTPWW